MIRPPNVAVAAARSKGTQCRYQTEARPQDSSLRGDVLSGRIDQGPTVACLEVFIDNLLQDGRIDPLPPGPLHCSAVVNPELAVCNRHRYPGLCDGMGSRPLDPGVVCQTTVEPNRVTAVSVVKPLQTSAYIEPPDVREPANQFGGQQLRPWTLVTCRRCRPPFRFHSSVQVRPPKAQPRETVDSCRDSSQESEHMSFSPTSNHETTNLAP